MDTAQHHILHSFTHTEWQSLSQLHSNKKWLTHHLVLYLEALVKVEQQQVQGLDIPPTTQLWQSWSCPQPDSRLALLNPKLTVADLEEDSDSESLSSKQKHYVC